MFTSAEPGGDGSRLELVIFDCDGVLVDSEPLANAILIDELRVLGLALAEAEAARIFTGLTLADALARAERRLGRPLPDGFAERLQARTHDAFRRELRPVPGVAEALERIDLPVCVASSGSIEKMRATLGLTGLLARFEGRLFSATDLARGKPWPDLFLHAARAMGAAPARSAVVEDSLPGVRAGVAAGMAVLGYAPRQGVAAALAAAGARTFGSMAALPELLAASALGRPQ